jgi:hypothetical protein
MLSWNVLHRVPFRQKCHYVYHFFFFFFTHVHDVQRETLSLSEGVEVARRRNKKCQKKSFRRHHLFSAVGGG